MIIPSHVLANSSLWVVNIIYFIGICFQIYCNYQRKSVKGLSDLMLFGYLSAYVAQTFYVFTLDLPTSTQVMIPLCMWAVVIMVVQRFCYSFGKGYMYTFLLSYIIFLTIMISCIPLGYYYSYYVGWISGWAAVILWSFFQIPQIIKIYKEKSTAGFSFLFVLLMTIGGLVELISSITLKLPWPTIISIARGLLLNIVFCFQFYLYNRTKNR